MVRELLIACLSGNLPDLTSLVVKAEEEGSGRIPTPSKMAERKRRFATVVIIESLLRRKDVTNKRHINKIDEIYQSDVDEKTGKLRELAANATSFLMRHFTSINNDLVTQAALYLIPDAVGREPMTDEEREEFTLAFLLSEEWDQ